MKKDKEGKIFVIAGPSGVGKYTTEMAILDRFEGAVKVLNTTSRELRSMEKNLKDYRFVTRKEFLDTVKKGEFLEYNDFHGNFYGTRYEDLEKARKSAEIVVWELDVNGVLNVMNKVDGLVKIFITVEDHAHLEKRIFDRGSVPENMKKRLEGAHWEMSQINIFDYVVINKHGQVEDTIEEVTKIVEKHTGLTAKR